MVKQCFVTTLLRAGFALSGLSGAGAAPALEALPPLRLGVSLEPPFPDGTAVSQPLRCPPPGSEAAILETPPTLNTVVTRAGPECPPAAFDVAWADFEFLAMLPKGAPTPPVVTASRGVPVLGAPGTAVLLGGRDEDGLPLSGGRLSAGFAVNREGTAALGGNYFFLGSRTQSASVATKDGRGRNLGRPFFDPVRGEPAVLALAPADGFGRVRLLTSTRATGWEVYGLGNLVHTPELRVDVLTGFRYFQVSEGLTVEHSVAQNVTPVAGVSDEFQTRNVFHGGQVGVNVGTSLGGFDLGVRSHVALGRTNARSRIRGATVARLPTGEVQQSPGGVLAVASNSGTADGAEFAVLSEVGVEVGYRLAEQSRFYLGYQFLYLSNAVRPGHQVDLAIDPGQIPLNAGRQVAVDRPGALFVRDDYWLQGFVFGVEYRY